MTDDEKSPGRWTPINFGWKYLNYVIIGVGLIVGFCVWALPNRWADPEIQAGMERLRERQIAAAFAKQGVKVRFVGRTNGEPVTKEVTQS